MKTVVDTIMASLVGLIAIVSIFLNVWLANVYRYHKTCARCDAREIHFWKETALLYQKQIHEAVDRH